MAGPDKKLTDLTELTTPSNDSFIHVVEPGDISQSPDGSSYKVKKSNFSGGLSDAPSDGNQYARKDAAWEVVNDALADHFKGNWNASTNSPTLTNGVGNVGDYYYVTVAGNLFSTLWAVGDIISYNGTTWYRLSSNDTSVITTNTNITSSNLSTQDVSGFVAYINSLNPIITVALNEIRTYSVTNTGQKFEILSRGRSFGFSEVAISNTDVLELERPENYKIIRQTSAAAHTGSLGNVTIASIVISPSDWNGLDMVEIRSTCRRTTSVANLTLRYNMTDGVTSAPIGLYTQTTTQQLAPFERLRLSMDASGNLRGLIGSLSVVNDSAVGNSSVTTFNKANNITVSISIQLGDITDSITLDSFSVTLRRKY